jgi:hypothetical protein
MDYRKCQTPTATPPEAGDLPLPLGVERALFYFVCVGAVGAFNIFNSVLAGIAVFIGGFAFGYWATNSDQPFSASSPGQNGTNCATTQPSNRFPAWRCSNAAPK